jgi:hypothetical protein
MSAGHLAITVGLVAAGVFVINVPFGYWRANVRKFSTGWFLAVHGSVPAVAFLRIQSGLGFTVSTVPFMAAAYFSGQVLGSRMFTRRRRHAETPLTSCLIWDLVKSPGGSKSS